MRPGAVSICSSHSACSHLKPITYDLHKLLDVLNGHFCQSNYINFLFSVFSTLQKFPVIYQVEQLPAIYFVERNHETQFLILLKSLHNVARCHQIQTRDLPVTRAHHSVSLTTASLAVSKTSCICSLKSAAYQRLHTNLVDLWQVGDGKHLLIRQQRCDQKHCQR